MKFAELPPEVQAELLTVPELIFITAHPLAEVTLVTPFQVNIELHGFTHLYVRPREENQ